MGTKPRFALPKSNAGLVAHQMASRTNDSDGSGLIDLLELLVERAEQIQAATRRAGEFSEKTLSGEIAPEPAEFKTELQDGVYEPLSLKLFLACAFRALAEQLKLQLYQNQSHLLRGVKEVVFTDEGEIASLSLEDADVAVG